MHRQIAANPSGISYSNTWLRLYMLLKHVLYYARLVVCQADSNLQIQIQTKT